MRTSTGEIAAKIHRSTKRPRSGYAIITFALVIVAVELGRYWLIGHPLHWQPEAIAFVLGFVGFYVRNPSQTLTGATFLVDSAGKFLLIFRTGRRATDPVVVVKPDEPPEGQ